jgi:hypothetical protein
LVLGFASGVRDSDDNIGSGGVDVQSSEDLADPVEGGSTVIEDGSGGGSA